MLGPQEVLLIPQGAAVFSEALRIACETRNALEVRVVATPSPVMSCPGLMGLPYCG